MNAGRRTRASRGAFATSGARRDKLPLPLTTQTIVSAATGPARVLFADDHLEWREMEGVTHSLSYAYLSELRVQARATGSTRLIAVEKSGRRWELPLKSDDVASVQAVLDMVDGRLAGAGPNAAASAVPRLVALLTAVVALSTGQAAAGLVALLTTTYTQSRLLVASAAAAASAGILLILELSSGTGPLHWLAFLLVCLACVLVGLARTTRRGEPEALSDTPVKILAAVSGLIVLWLAVDGLDPIGLHQNIVMLPGAAVLVLALGAALIADTRRSLRRAAPAALAIGALLVAARSARFLDLFGSDPFLVSASEIPVQTIAAEPQAEFDAPTRIAEIRLSPGARTIAMLDEEASDGDRNDPMTFYVGPPGGPFEQIRADDLALEENGRALVLSIRDDGVDLREIDIANPSVTLWQQHVPDITSSARLRLSGSREWQVLGLVRRQRIVRAVGRVGESDAALTSWTVPSNSEYGWMDAVSAEGDGALYVESAFGSGPMSGSLLGRWYAALHAREESRLWHLSRASQLLAAHSRLSVHCTTGDPGSASLRVLRVRRRADASRRGRALDRAHYAHRCVPGTLPAVRLDWPRLDLRMAELDTGRRVARLESSAHGCGPAARVDPRARRRPIPRSHRYPPLATAASSASIPSHDSTNAPLDDSIAGCVVRDCSSSGIIAAMMPALVHVQAQTSVRNPSSSSASTPPEMSAAVDPALLEGLEYRLAGPWRGGRVTTVTGVPSQPHTFYMGVASGGLFRTTDGGVTWTPITDGKVPVGFDRQRRGGRLGSERDLSRHRIGRRAQQRVDRPRHVQVDRRRTDLEVRRASTTPDRSARCASIRPIPTSSGSRRRATRSRRTPNAACSRPPTAGRPGRRCCSSPTASERWTSSCSRAIRTSSTPGCRGSNASRGRSSAARGTAGFYKSTDGGEHFTKIIGGLPAELIGKANLAVTAAKPDRIYALVEAKPGGGLYRSDDAGETWTLMNSQAQR